MRASISTLLGLLLFSFAAQAETSFQNFSWRADSRFDLKIVQDGTPMVIKGELRDGATATVPSKDQTVSVELKSYTTELFLVIAVTTATDDNGSIFLLERPNADWLVMNDSAIRARKLDLMKDFDGVLAAFKTVSNFGIAQSMRKMAEYFQKYPNKRLNDLYDSLEKGEDFVRTLPKPTTSGRSQGVVQPAIPKTRYEDPNAPEDLAQDVPVEEIRPEDVNPDNQADPELLPLPDFPAQVEGEELNRPSNKRRQTRRQVQREFGDEPDWVAQERARQRRWQQQEKRRQQQWRKEQQRRQRVQPRDPFSDDPYGNFPPPPSRRRNIFERLFDN